MPEETTAAPPGALWRPGPPFSTAADAAAPGGECESAVPGAASKAEGSALAAGCIKDVEMANGRCQAPSFASPPHWSC